MAVQSKLAAAVLCTCKEFNHPWTDKCVNGSAGMLLAATPYSLRTYTTVYVLSMLMRRKIPNSQDLCRLVLGILQSTAFFVTNTFSYSLFNCLIRNVMGRYHVSTVAFIPSFLASLVAIVVERPQRRPLLALYVANLATESVWNMAEVRGWVKSIPQGQAIIFGASMSLLLYLYRLGLHKTVCKDSLFGILRIFVGKSEEDNANPKESLTSDSTPQRSRPPVNLSTINGWVQMYSRFIEKLKGKHECCSHKRGCVHYAVLGGLKPLVGGVGLQVALKLLLNIKRMLQNKMDWKKTIFNKQTLNLGLFLGSFSFLYKSVSCGLRHGFNRDDPRFAIPAGLIGSLGYIYYPNTTMALYIMWKTLSIVYNLGIEKKIVPKVPGFTIILYAFCTAVLFHSAILEPKTIRPSYYKFLETFSGHRFSKYNLLPLETFGFDSTRQREEVLASLNLAGGPKLPSFSLANW